MGLLDGECAPPPFWRVCLIEAQGWGHHGVGGPVVRAVHLLSSSAFCLTFLFLFPRRKKEMLRERRKKAPPLRTRKLPSLLWLRMRRWRCQERVATRRRWPRRPKVRCPGTAGGAQCWHLEGCSNIFGFQASRVSDCTGSLPSCCVCLGDGCFGEVMQRKSFKHGHPHPVGWVSSGGCRRFGAVRLEGSASYFLLVPLLRERLPLSQPYQRKETT